jgi:hypothetical protein
MRNRVARGYALGVRPRRPMRRARPIAMKKQFLAAAAVVAAAVVPSSAQIVVPPGYSATVVASAAGLGVPGPLGGVTFSPDGATLFVGGGANGPLGAVYAAPVVRDPVTQSVVGFGTASYFHAAPYVDGGLAIDAAGTFHFSTYPTNELGQFNGATSAIFPLPVESATTGGLCFGRAPSPLAGTLFVSSYSNGDVFTCALTPNGNGTSTPTALTLWAELPPGREGIAFVPSGSAAGDLLVTNYGLGSISLIDVDPSTGLPVGGASGLTLFTFATGISGGEGFAFDPVTNDFLVSTFQGNPHDSIVRISGFAGPNFPMTGGAPSFSAATGGAIPLVMAGGLERAGATYVVFSGTSGSVPGLTYGFQHVPLNYDLFTDLVLPLVNTPYFQNFVGTFDAAGAATAVFAPPPIPAAAVGVTITFSSVAIYPTFSGASVPVGVLIAP